MENQLKAVLEKIKEPTLKFHIQAENRSTPNLMSHVGGKPFILKKEPLPQCGGCGQKMHFVFQLYIPKDPDYHLYCFYYCMDCEPSEGTEGFAVLHYLNPRLEDARCRFPKSSLLPYGEFDFYPEWSLPDWETLVELKPGIVQNLHADRIDAMWDAYDATRESITGPTYQGPLSFYRGFPQFVTSPEFPSCSACQKKMKLFLQMDSYHDLGVIWGSLGCLFLFFCEEHHQFSLFVQ